ncbi:carbohydrate kinase family protein [Patescibacteria group bacterium]|nr:carbohydrate kinase family protein [Patescibacteria group bacterium]
MKHNIITIGGSTEDIMFYTKEAVLVRNNKDILRQQLLGFEFGAKIVGEKVFFTYGGGGSNTAVNFSKLGLKTGVITAIGDDDNGQRIIKNFKNNKVSAANIQTIKKVPSGLSFIVNFSGTTEHVIFTYRSANNQLLISEKSLSKAKADWFYLASLSGPKWPANLKNIFEHSAKKKIKIGWNPGASQLAKGYSSLKKYLQQTEVLILNKDEAIELVLSSGYKTQNINQLLKYLKLMGPAVVAITQGAKGAAVCSGNQICSEKALPIQGINTTGAGDAFGSSLVAGLIIYKDLAKALKLAIHQSNYVIREIGAQKGLLSIAQLKKNVE